MQEEVNKKVICLVVSGSKMTGRTLGKTLKAYLQHQKDKKYHPKIRHGKQTLKQLKAQNIALENVDISKENIKSFYPIARKYKIDFALKKDTLKEPPQYHVFFKGRDTNTLNMAFQEYTAKILNQERKPSIHKMLAELKARTQTQNQQQEKTRKKERSVAR